MVEIKKDPEKAEGLNSEGNTTPHIGAPKDGNKFGEVVLCPGDPYRAKWMANKYLENPEMVTEVRGIMGFTGMFEGARVSILASGMGMPSAHIYWHELITMYGVKKIIRTGTCGTTKPKPLATKIGDVIIV